MLPGLAGGVSPTTPDLASHGSSAGGLSCAWPLGAIAAVLYGSLIPFNMDWTAFQQSNGFGLLKLGLRVPTFEDAVTNVLVYVPVGLTLVLCVDGRALKRLARVPFAVFVGTAVSLFAETLQTTIAIRVASWTDVAFNVLGTAVGAMLGATLLARSPAALGRLRRQLVDRPFATLASAVTIGLFLYELAPFDFVTDTAGLHASFGRARWELAGVQPVASGDPSFALMIRQLTGAAWFAALGCLLLLAGRRAGRRLAVALASAVKHGFVLACLIECMQLFTLSHQFDLAVVVLRTLAATFGGWCAAFMVDGSASSRWKQRASLAMPTRLLVVLGVFQILVLLMSSLDSGGYGRHGGWPLLSIQYIDLATVQWIPFESLWHRPMAKAASEVLATLVAYGTLAVTCAMIVRRIRIAPVWLITGVTVTLVATAVEAIQACTTSRTADLTGPTLAVLALIGVSRILGTLWPTQPSGDPVEAVLPAVWKPV